MIMFITEGYNVYTEFSSLNSSDSLSDNGDSVLSVQFKVSDR